MSDLNPSQEAIATTLDGMVVVDAGPGTGKTHTIVQRYINLITRDTGDEPAVTPRDVLLLTFTRNAAAEMEERIKREMSKEGMAEEAKLVQVLTFDAFCLSVVMESPYDAGRLFGIDERLTHSVRLVENDTLNRNHFTSFLEVFLDSRGEDYGDSAIVCSQIPGDLYALIGRLMSRGIFPLKRGGWFGGSDGKELVGDTAELLARMRSRNEVSGRAKSSDMRKALASLKPLDCDPLPEIGEDACLDDSILVSAAEDDRSELLRLVHDVYWEYIRSSMADDRLTFGLNAMLAFSVLYSNPGVRKLNSYRYVMIDEFQDTNASQLMMALMMLKEPNLCVVGDWKQGIYGFRFVSIENITEFERRTVELRRVLNDDLVRVEFSLPEAVRLHLDMNYRSSQLIVDHAFRCLRLKGNKQDEPDHAKLDRTVKLITAARDPDIAGDTRVRFVKAASRDDEAIEVARCVRDYVGSGNYTVHARDGARPLGYGDIAVLCRTTQGCRNVVERLAQEGIPAFLQGDVEIMATREGKLLLAWMRYVSNERDAWGYAPILADLGYPPSFIDRVCKGEAAMPAEIASQREYLFRKRRRVTEMMTSVYDWYGLDNDVTQAIVNVLSAAHRDSLLTISDLIAMIDGDLSSGRRTVYPVDAELDGEAVIVTTMHKAKGLEFPAVIIPYVDTRVMPSSGTDTSDIWFDSVAGVRCSRTVGRFEGYSKLCRSWRTALVRSTVESDYDEERRLMFVAMSRAMQYETVICGPKPSQFMVGLSNDLYEAIPDAEAPPASVSDGTAPRPDLSGYTVRKQNVGVHSVMRFDEQTVIDQESGSDEICGKGKEYGTAVHEEAQAMDHGVPPSGRYPEAEYIRDSVLSRKSLDGFLRSYSEIECTLPVRPSGVCLKGVIDLMLLYEDRVEIHDYKTDVSDRFQPEYVLQLSVYAHAAAGYYGGRLPVRCYIDYVSQGRTVEFDPMPLEDVETLVGGRLSSQNTVANLRTAHIRHLNTRAYEGTDLGGGCGAQGPGPCERLRGEDQQDLHRYLPEEPADAVQHRAVHTGHPAPDLPGAHQRGIRHWDHHREHPDLHRPGDAREAPPGQDLPAHQAEGQGVQGRRRGRGGPVRGREGRRRHPPRRGPGRRGRRHRGVQVAGDGRVPPHRRVQHRQEEGRRAHLLGRELRHRRGVLHRHRLRGRLVRVPDAQQRQEVHLQEDAAGDGDRHRHQDADGDRGHPVHHHDIQVGVRHPRELLADPPGLRAVPRRGAHRAVPAHNADLHDRRRSHGRLRGAPPEDQLRRVDQPR